MEFTITARHYGVGAYGAHTVLTSLKAGMTPPTEDLADA
jgi:hypothetical protein